MATDPLIHGPRKKAVLAAAAAAVLAVGWLIAPPRRMTPASEERVAPILEQEIGQRDPVRLLRGAQETGRRVSGHVVEVRPRRAPSTPRVAADVSAGEAGAAAGGFGLLLADGRVLTHLAALDGDLEPVISGADADRPARVVAADARTALALVQPVADGASPSAMGPELRPAIAAAAPQAGTPAIGAARTQGVELVAPLIVASVAGDRITLSAASGITRAGTPVFSTAGEALAIAAGPREQSAAFLIAPAIARMQGLPAGGGASTLGVALQEPAGELSAVLGEGGVPIADVRAGSAAAGAGLRPSDVLVAVAGTPVADVEAARRAIARLPAGTDAALEVRRGGVTRPVTVRPTLWRPLAEETAEGVPAASLLGEEALARLTLGRGARVLAVDGAPPPASARAIAEWRRRRAPSVLQVESGGARYLVVADPR